MEEKLKTAPTQVVLARKEVILCGGAVHSPALLLLSGIGPREDLEALKIPVVAHSPGVGKNLRDHLLIVHNYLSTDDQATTDPPNLLRLLPSIGEVRPLPFECDDRGQRRLTDLVRCLF